ncbi:unnamed protein product [Ectocarpus sp. 4 AP-2014]
MVQVGSHLAAAGDRKITRRIARGVAGEVAVTVLHVDDSTGRAETEQDGVHVLRRLLGGQDIEGDNLGRVEDVAGSSRRRHFLAVVSEVHDGNELVLSFMSCDET